MAAHDWLGVDIDDPRITLAGPQYDVQPMAVTIHEDFVTNPLHTLLIAGALVWAVVVMLEDFSNRRPLILMVVAMGSLVMFCATLRWQLYHTRLHLPIFMLAAAPVGMMLGSASVRNVSPWICGLLLVSTVPFLFWNPSHRWLGEQSIFRTSREEQYFPLYRSMETAYRPAADYLAAGGYDTIGLLAEHDDWEYPLWVLMHDRLGRWPNIQDDSAANDKLVGRPDLQWPGVSAIVVTRAELLNQLIVLPAYSHWRVKKFGVVSVLTRPG